MSTYIVFQVNPKQERILTELILLQFIHNEQLLQGKMLMTSAFEMSFSFTDSWELLVVVLIPLF